LFHFIGEKIGELFLVDAKGDTVAVERKFQSSPRDTDHQMILHLRFLQMEKYSRKP